MPTRKKIGLIGAGNIGGELARLCANEELGDVFLYDIPAKENFAKGKALDLEQNGAVARLRLANPRDGPTGRISRGRRPHHHRRHPAQAGPIARRSRRRPTCRSSATWPSNAKKFCPNAFVIVISNPLDAMVYEYRRVVGAPKKLVAGMAGVLDSARFQLFLAREAGVSVKDVRAMVLGGHGDDMVPVLSMTHHPRRARLGAHREGQARQDRRPHAQGRRRDRQPHGDERVLRPGVERRRDGQERTCTTRSACSPCAAYLEGEYGYRDLFMGVPVRHRGQGGREDRRDPADRRREGDARQERQERAGRRRHLQKGLRRPGAEKLLSTGGCERPESDESPRFPRRYWPARRCSGDGRSGPCARSADARARASSRSRATRAGPRSFSGSTTRRSRPGGRYRDDTVVVFVPAHYRFRRRRGSGGARPFARAQHHRRARDRRAQLREQLAESKQNAVLVVPQLAVSTADSSCGKLESPGGLVRLLDEAVATAAREGRSTLGDTAYPVRAPLGTVCVSAHSGGYHAAACALRVGGVDVRETYLFDALYAEADAFRDWVVARHGEPLHRRHKLVSYFTVGAATEANDRLLRAELERAGVNCAEELQEGELSRHDLSHAEAVFVRSGEWHSNVTWETNALRDCLYASALPRHLGSTWFARKNGARPIERRR